MGLGLAASGATDEISLRQCIVALGVAVAAGTRTDNDQLLDQLLDFFRNHSYRAANVRRTVIRFLSAVSARAEPDTRSALERYSKQSLGALLYLK